MSQLPGGSECVPDPGPSNNWLRIEEGQQYLLEDVKRLPYEHVDILGYGSSAYVEKVRDRNTGQVYAKKTCIFSDMRSRHDKEVFFNNEIQITQLLKGHHHIVQLYATYVAQTEMGLMLQPAADGYSLDRYLSSYWTYSEMSVPSTIPKSTMTQALEQAFGCLAGGLAFIHDKGIRHRDIKPQNILMHRHSVVITDFGSSRNTTQLGKDTTEGNVDFKTLRYSAPEVHGQTKRSFEADVYSLGCVFIELFSALCHVIQDDLNAEYAQIMDKTHKLIDRATIATRFRFLKDVIKSMTRQDRSQRCGLDTVFQQMSQQSGFCCAQCNANHLETGKTQLLSFTKWEWVTAQGRYLCYILDQHSNKIGHKWDGSPQTTVMYAEASSRCESPGFSKCGPDVFFANICYSTGTVSKATSNVYDQQLLLLPSQPSSSNIYSGLDLEVSSE
ncbi:kinase-like protein [Phaeosphaeriaceae sp. SRC1lsM3a]|nr:kinase-like protein [Stagonospora sp. SRC1lsM3a]